MTRTRSWSPSPVDFCEGNCAALGGAARSGARRRAARPGEAPALDLGEPVSAVDQGRGGSCLWVGHDTPAVVS